MRIGQYQLRNRLIAAPMAGITDRPFRTLCYEMGAGLTVSEMMSSNPQVWESDKSRLRMVHIDEPGIRTVQIAGSDPKEMADAARINVESGAQIIDINMGCPAKKVNRKLAGSALLQYPDVVKSILTEVVNAVDVPVTLKIRTGWAPEHRNCEEIAQLAEDCGIQALTIHATVHAPVCSMEKLSTTVFGQLSRKFPFRLSRMVTLLTRLKPELCSTIQGRMP